MRGTPKQVADHLGKMRDNLQEFAQVGRTTLGELMTDAFIKSETGCGTFTEFRKVGGIDIDDDALTLAVFDTPEWNGYIAANTRFSDWKSMQQSALKVLAIERMRG